MTGMGHPHPADWACFYVGDRDCPHIPERDKMALGCLKVITPCRPEQARVTVEEALGCSKASAREVLRRLVDAELIGLDWHGQIVIGRPFGATLGRAKLRGSFEEQAEVKSVALDCRPRREWDKYDEGFLAGYLAAVEDPERFW